MAERESSIQARLRWDKLDILRHHYKHFPDFLEDVMGLLGFSTTDVQEDIASFMEHGPDFLMVQAQRGEAKTTIASAFAVWSLIIDPTFRVLVVSAGGGQASDISTLIVRIIMTMPQLECLRPDKSNGDRSSVEHFDVHHTLKGVDKSPSVKCLGITSNLQGPRADLLLADDVESAKNATTAVMRAQLLQLTLDFTSIVTGNDRAPGRIVWLGTPQTSDSIYNTLPSRGVTVRIWPGRYPTPEQVDNYGDRLAPQLRRRMERDNSLMFGGGLLGNQGKPTDPRLFSEEKLQAKELDQGASYFQLQHMLNTRLIDALRYPLKPTMLVVANYQEQMPLSIVRGLTPATERAFSVHGHAFRMQSIHSASAEAGRVIQIMAYIDPAGGGVNADETAYAVTAFHNGNIYLLDVGGLPGGYAPDTLEELADRLLKWKPPLVKIEKNMGFGAFQAVFAPILARKAKEVNHQCATDEDYVTGQKELRIIATLEPIINQGRLIVNSTVVDTDTQDCMRYAAARRQVYSFFYQLAKISRDRGSLVHDDRLDAVEGAVRHWQSLLRIDAEAEVEKAKAKERADLLRDPLGHHRYSNNGPSRSSSYNLLSRFKR